MTIIFASNDEIDFTGGTNVTTAGTFDSNYVDSSVQVNSGQNCEIIFTPPATEMWVHADVYCSQNSVASDGWYFDILDPSLALVTRAEVLNAEVGLFLQTSTGVTQGTRIPALLDLRPRPHDFHFVISGGNLTVTFYLENSPVNRLTRTLGTTTMPNTIRFDPVDVGTLYFSQVIVSDRPTLGRKLFSRLPNSQGFYNDWTGGFTELADTNALTFAQTGTVNANESSIPQTYTGEAAPLEDIVLTLAGSRDGTSGPQQVRQFLRFGGADYLANSSIPVETSLTTGLSSFPVNPSNSLPWTTADLVGMEMGIRGVG